MLVNRVGDIGLVLAMIMIIREFGTLDFSVINGIIIGPVNNINLTIMCLLLFLGAVGKSAQLGLHT